MEFTIELHGVNRAMNRIQKLAADTPRQGKRALRREAEIELTEMKKRTPVATGALKGSGRVEEAGGISVRWAFGGPAIDYALPVHEDVEAFHHVGQAKFVESVLAESASRLPARVAARLAELLGTR